MLQATLQNSFECRPFRSLPLVRRAVLSQLIQSINDLHVSRHAGHVAVGAKLRYAIDHPIMSTLAVNALNRQRLGPAFLVERLGSDFQ